MIQWPCVLKLDGDAELIFVATERELEDELDALIWDDSDHLIDSKGQRYLITQLSGKTLFERVDGRLSLQVVTELIQEHEFSKAEVCLTKIQFLSVREAILSLA
jgi:hypothetical protein